MTTVKERIHNIIQSQPEDSSYEEILRELTFERMVDRGLDDYRKERFLTSDEMEHRIRQWGERV